MNNYNNRIVSTGNMINFGKMQNIYILDKIIGDVNGDNKPDTVYLVGKKGENPFYENIKVIVQDGRTKQRYVIPLYPRYSIGTDPWLFLGNFTNLNVDEIMVSLPVPGSGALTYYYVISLVGNKVEYMLGPEEFIRLTQPLGFRVIFMDGYKVLVKSEKLNQSYTLDVSSRKEFYEGKVYDQDGLLIKPLNGFVIYQPHLYPVRFDGSQPYKLESRQDIAGTARVDGLGNIITYWIYTEDKKWVLDPESFFVMLI